MAKKGPSKKPKKLSGNKVTVHHIVPKSRCRELGIDNPNFPGNTVKKTWKQHQAYHTLFGNATPDEAINILMAEWASEHILKILARRKRRWNLPVRAARNW